MSFAARCRNSAAAWLVCGLLAACGDTNAPVVLPLKSLASTPTGEPVSLVYRPDSGNRYVATVQHTLRVHGGQSAPDTTQPDGNETWVVTLGVSSPTLGEFSLTIDGEAKRSLETQILSGNTHWTVLGTTRSTALYRVLTDPGLAGLGGVVSWLPQHPVRVGGTWPIAHIPVPTDLPSGLQRTADVFHVRLDAVDPDGAWHVRLAMRTTISGTPRGREDAVPIKIVDRVRGTAVIDGTTGQPRSFSIHCERIQIESGQTVQEAERRIEGTVVPVDLNVVAPR